jgi:hypothetical protein
MPGRGAGGMLVAPSRAIRTDAVVLQSSGPALSANAQTVTFRSL